MTALGTIPPPSPGQAGARALRYARNHGKAMAMMVGAREVAELDRRRPADGPRHLLFLDADLGPPRDARAR